MATATSPASSVLQQSLEGMRSVAESVLESQREFYENWAKLWPGMTQSSDWASQKEKLVKDWASAVTDMVHRQRTLADQRYQACIETLEESFRVLESEDPHEVLQRYESLCRKTLEMMKSTSESQMQQFQEALSKWIDLCQMKS